MEPDVHKLSQSFDQSCPTSRLPILASHQHRRRGNGTLVRSGAVRNHLSPALLPMLYPRLQDAMRNILPRLPLSQAAVVHTSPWRAARHRIRGPVAVVHRAR
jgi:hypothetical protein